MNEPYYFQAYHLSAEVLEHEILLFKTPITMEKVCSLLFYVLSLMSFEDAFFFVRSCAFSLCGILIT